MERIIWSNLSEGSKTFFFLDFDHRNDQRYNQYSYFASKPACHLWYDQYCTVHSGGMGLWKMFAKNKVNYSSSDRIPCYF